MGLYGPEKERIHGVGIEPEPLDDPFAASGMEDGFPHRSGTHSCSRCMKSSAPYVIGMGVREHGETDVIGGCSPGLERLEQYAAV